MTVLIVAANYHQTRRHYAIQLTPMRRGASGASLCATDVFDQEYQNFTAEIFGSKPVDNASLPLCKLCERKAAKEGMEVPT